MTWPGEHNYTRSARVRGARRRGQHAAPPHEPGYYIGECVSLSTRADSHTCDATCRHLRAAQDDDTLWESEHPLYARINALRIANLIDQERDEAEDEYLYDIPRSEVQ